MFLINKIHMKKDCDIEENKKSYDSMSIYDDLSIDEMDSEQIIKAIKDIRHRLVCTDLWFQDELDSDLIDSCIYQIEALNARYRHLILRAREQKITSPPW